eukprot:TRINITY_DN1688_c0_g1_i8.p2 TRINITY_DN1688_c0_g1~~TRINITY_DN1688_c0_g1_i8.p2  ORF type:complete len:445 (-),score=57.31 TRINITY_DN1688_c0_g1_i8:407-1741(-)
MQSVSNIFKESESMRKMLSMFKAILQILLITPALCVNWAPFQEIKDEAYDLQQWLTTVRRRLHQYPELMYELNQTNQIVTSYLQQLSILYRSPVAKSGIIATIGSGEPVVGLRADMDALPIQEPEGLSYRSKNDGAMHACGHDAHMTMLLGAAKILKNREKELKGTVKLIFQPAEEGGAGGSVMVNEGVADDVSMMFALHVWPYSPSGVVASKPQTLLASAIQFQVYVQGKGGHAATPHIAADPIVAAVNIINALQTLVSRETSPLDSLVISVTKMETGHAFNVIPDNATFGGTIRTLTEDKLMESRKRIQQMVKSVAQAYGCKAQVDWMEKVRPYYPATINHPKAFAFVEQVSKKLLTEQNERFFSDIETTMAGEDFAFFARKVPACMIFLGMGNETAGSISPLHNPNFKVDETVLPRGAALLSSLAMQFLESAETIGKKQEL